MAAVAGSKGRVRRCTDFGRVSSNRRSYQAQIASAVLSGTLTPHEAAADIISRARLREVGVDTNMMCNLACKYCYLDDRPVRKGELSASQWLDILSPLASIGCKLFAFIGKEPLLDDIAITALEGLDRLRATSGRRFRTGMVTNGTRLHHHISRLRDANLSYLDVSLDGLPDVNDAWRGSGTATLVLENVQKYMSTIPAHDVFVTCVLHQGNAAHVSEFATRVFDIGVPGFFTSPVLKFTKNEDIASWAIDADDLDRAIEGFLQLATRLHLSATRQIVVDLPYKYSWWMIGSGRVSVDKIFEDEYEVPYFQPDPLLPIYIKMNLLSFSFFRAVRITHDGFVINNMDLAAHPEYAIRDDRLGVAAPFTDVCRIQGVKFHESFLDEHLEATIRPESLHDRNVSGQVRRFKLMSR